MSPTKSIDLTLPRVALSDGSIEGLKWIALICMLGDHINKYLLNGTADWLYYIGRLAMPIFMFVLAFNLARPDALEKGLHGRVIVRLALFGILATPSFLALGGLINGWWPLNILFALLVFTVIVRLIEIGSSRAYIIAALTFLFGGSIVEFWWPVLIFGVAVWSYTKRPSLLALCAIVASYMAFGWINGNQWAAASSLLILLASLVSIQIPRCRWVFYVFYPGHLSLLWALRIPLKNAGYLFFT
ncbi:TraX family protein [Pseudomonas juntendi]|uniref:TraX family protein n=1 Tax=Pseudomonas juntendi TaxID=2666183 RepID=UPI003B93151D